MSTYRIKNRKVKKPQDSPEQIMCFEELCNILRRTGTNVRIESGHFRSGLCNFEDRWIFFINRNRPIEQNIDSIVEYLKNQNLGNIYISPKIRSQIGENGLKDEE